MLGQNLSKICTTVISFFNTRATKLGKAINFVKRESKLTAKLFAESLIMGCLSNPNLTLEDMRQLVKQRGIKISKQGLHQRFNQEATELMKTLFEESLQKFKTEKHDVIALLKPFSSVIILDSSSISLPVNLKNLYEGFGGGASEAGLKIQMLLDYVNGQIKDVAITGARKNDQGFTDHLNKIEKGALYLQDLGYFNTESLNRIKKTDAYFVSRYLLQTKVFDPDEQQIDLLKELNKAGSFFAKEVLLGQQNKVKVRLIAYLLPDEEVEKRLRKLKKAAQKKGRAPTQETLALARWSIFVTNVSEDILDNKQVYLVYILRWQIELFFKLCKSQVGIDKTNGKNQNRVLCEIYAKLIGIVTFLYLCFPVRWQKNQELSFFRAYKRLRQRFSDFFTALKSPYRLLKFLKGFLDDLKNFSLKEKPRKKRLATYQKIMNATNQEVLV
jgi:DDE family transposase